MVQERCKKFAEAEALATSSKTDVEILRDAASSSYQNDLRSFMRHAADNGYEVLISHKVG